MKKFIIVMFIACAFLSACCSANKTAATKTRPVNAETYPAENK